MPYSDPEKARQNKRRYYQNNRELLREKSKCYYEENREAKITAQQVRYAKNRERELAQKVEYYKKNKEAIDARKKAYYEANREKVQTQRREEWARSKDQKNSRKRELKYGIAMAEYEARMLSQGGLCPICQGELNRPNIDHCHQTQKARGILCNLCNLGLGAFRDNITALRNAADYLEYYQEKDKPDDEKDEATCETP